MDPLKEMVKENGSRGWKSRPRTWNRLKEPARQNRRDPTKAEDVLWQLLRLERDRGFKFRRQHAIGPYIVDFYCASARLAIEVDGPIHEEQGEQDAARTEFIRAFGVNVLRVTNEQVLTATEETVALIRQSLQPSPSP
ncbi:MAG TPA: DUF559 domain-containing protein [Dehalococcoidia bacterium]|jgi:very-short-patch-repair endonuclease|nr:DUF559 domain-containing protein [Dehalococcoidia bacterium]